MESMIANIITLLPNIAVAILMLYWQRQTIDSLLDNQTKLIDRLLNYVDADKQRAEMLISQRAKTQPRRAASSEPASNHTNGT